MICNAAGSLPPALALEMRQCFQCPVLPSYGMTECMPISSPPVDFDELAPTTSGVPCGPSVAIIGEAGAFLGPGEVGQIALRGAPLMKGYVQVEANNFCWNGDGWFLTGDLGKLDENGWLEVTGRTKEVIKKGGITLSPVEVENAIAACEDLQKEFAEFGIFAVKDEDFGENV